MALDSGQRLGPYEILSLLGSGGIGEVYRARDTRLDRIVALKVLRQDLLADAESRQRFQREAWAVSRLNHPHICSIYDVGEDHGLDFLVMEFLDGETLAARLEKGRLPFRQALRHAIEIARALEDAHDAGIVHRDLKPGNIMVGKSGVKLLDFGLAKPYAKTAPAFESDLAALTTEKRESLVTVAGRLIGTPQYMAPEQFEGQDADIRTDIFALGLVLHEMMTGRRAFEGKSRAAVMAAIMSSEPPPVSSSHSELPSVLDPIIAHCLAKRPTERWQSAHDVALQLEELEKASPRSVSAGPGRRSGWIAAILAAAAIGTVATFLLVSKKHAAPPEVIHFSVEAPEGAELGGPYWNLPAVSPDGRSLAFAAITSGRYSLWLRPFDTAFPRRLNGTDGALAPFWAPDGRSIGFFADNNLEKVNIEDGNIQRICDVGGPSASGSWGPDGTIVFAVLEAPGGEGIYKVSARGGEPSRLVLQSATGDSLDLRAFFPQFLPDGRHFFVAAWNKSGEGHAYVMSTDSPELKELRGAPFSRLQYSSNGYLLGVSGNTLSAYRLDLGKLAVTGEPIPIAQNVENFNGAASFSESSGTLAYLPAGVSISTLSWFDRTGRPQGSVGAPGDYNYMRISPDGNRVAVSISDSKSMGDIWVLQLPSGMATRLTSDLYDDFAPIWSPDGLHVVFSSARGDVPRMFRMGLDGGQAEDLLPANGHFQRACGWSPDGQTLLYADRDPKTSYDLWKVSLADRTPVPVLRTQFKEPHGSISPDGRWLAYSSDESGRFEVYVQPFPGSGEKRRLSDNGGWQALWRGDGHEVFYLGLDNRLYAVPFQGLDRNERSPSPEPLFPVNGSVRGYDVSPDGRRFLVNYEPTATSGLAFQVVVNWESRIKAPGDH